MKLELRATPEEVMRAVDALREFGQANQVPEKPLFGLTLALEECGSNIVNHAFRHDPNKSFEVAFERLGNAVSIELRDRGPEFDPTKAAQPQNREDQAGSWGIQLVRRYMDEVCYRREAGQNVLRLTKRLNDAPH